MAKRRKVGNLLALAILAQLSAGKPMHPYEIATVLKQQGKDRDMNIKWGSLYTVVGNLEKYRFIEATTSDRAGRRPERTVYAITEAGRDELYDWLRDLVARPEQEFPRFEAALSVLAVLGPDEVITLLRRRLDAIEEGIAAQRAELRQLTWLPRLFLVESEYSLAMREAEAVWVCALLGEMTSGAFDGIDAWRTYRATGEIPAEFQQLLAEGGPPAEPQP